MLWRITPEILPKPCTGNGRGHFALVNISNTGLLRSYVLCFFVYSFCYSFCASGINLCMPECPAVLAWLYRQVRIKHVQIHMLLFFTSTKQRCTFPKICSNPCPTATFKTGSQQLLGVRMANTGTSTVDGDMEQLFWASRPLTMHCMCSYACAKDFQLETKITFFM